MPDKPKVAFYWCASCGGCEESVVDLADALLDVAAQIEIVLWPVATDFKKYHVEKMADKSIDVTLINGAVRTSEQEEMVGLLRRKSKLIIAYGACAQLGGIPGLANQFSRQQLLSYVYHEAPTVDNPDHVEPLDHFVDDRERVVALPELRKLVRALDQVIRVDYTLPGCPPTPKLLLAALQAILKGELPPPGTVLAPDTALCEECPRKASKPVDLAYSEFHRPHLRPLDPELCFLAQGIVCMGPATRGGCEAACTRGNMPCTGCFGPTSHVRDQGAKMLSAISSAVGADESESIDQILAGIPDPVGTFYRYGLPHCRLRAHVITVPTVTED